MIEEVVQGLDLTKILGISATDSLKHIQSGREAQWRPSLATYSAILQHLDQPIEALNGDMPGVILLDTADCAMDRLVHGQSQVIAFEISCDLLIGRFEIGFLPEHADVRDRDTLRSVGPSVDIVSKVPMSGPPQIGGLAPANLIVLRKECFDRILHVKEYAPDFTAHLVERGRRAVHRREVQQRALLQKS
ncbi:hypothetical protein [Sphingomonas sp. Ant H11]|uniref:hypothetical protein n=1 Tax=Sphingomonas sp. Ant H11 TaxID=1564113 RepID=UPI0012E03391|nr:hypothetical protein [Sphingomonas sp. Ant H11]